MTVLRSPRLTMRPPQASDLPAFTRFWTSPRTAFMGGPWSVDAARVEFPDLAGQWERHGFSMFVMTRTGDDAPLGLAGPFYPEGHPEPEIAWNLWDSADEGQGIAREAAISARDWFFSATSHRTAVSYTHPDNERSDRLAAAIGGVVDQGSACPYPPPVVIYRHRATATASGGSAA